VQIELFSEFDNLLKMRRTVWLRWTIRGRRVGPHGLVKATAEWCLPRSTDLFFD